MTGPFPLTGLQQAYLVGTGDLLELGGMRPTYYLELDVAGLDEQRAQAATDRLIARHEHLRTVIGRDGTQCVLTGPPPPCRTAVTDLREAAADDREQAFEQTRREVRDQGVDPFGWPLFDLRLHRLRAHRHRLHIGMSLMLLDAGGMHRVTEEWLRLYEDPACELPPVRRTYRERRLELRSKPASEQYWHERAETLPMAPQLPTVHRGGPAPRPVRRVHRMSAGEYRGFCERFRTRRVLPTAALLHVFAEVLGRWAAQPRFCVAVFHQSEASRESHADGFAGQFGAVLPLAVDLAADADPDRRAAALQRQLWNDMRHGDVDGTAIVRWMTAGRGWLPHPALPCVFTSLIGPDSEERGPARLRCRTVASGIRRPHVLIDNQVQPVGGAIECVWDTVDDAFPPGLPDLMFEAYRDLLTGLARDADRAAPATPGGPGATAAGRLEGGFLASALASPDAVALAEGRARISYGQLTRRSARIAAGLRARGIGRGDVVALRTTSGHDRVAAALGVLRAGAAFHISADGTSLAQLDERLRPALIIGAGGAADPPTVTVASLARTLAPPGAPVAGRPGDAACVLDEDTPVRMTHGAAAALTRDAAGRLGLGPADRVFAGGPPGGRGAVRDVFAALTAGATVVLPGGDRPAVTVSSSPDADAMVYLLDDSQDRPGIPGAIRVTGFGDTETWDGGPPLGDRALTVLDHAGRARDTWAAGDVHVTGPHLPLGCGSSYPTGLIGRRRPDGTVESLGEAGRQVALHGALVHPVRIERLLRQDPRVAEARVTVVDARLVATVEPPLDGLADALRGHLPARLIPEFRRSVAVDSAASLPRLTELCAGLLGHPAGPDDDLFAHGADSLTAVRLAAAAEAEWGVRLPLDRLPELRTARRLAALIDASLPAPALGDR